MAWTACGRRYLFLPSVVALLGCAGPVPIDSPPEAGFEPGDPDRVVVFALDEVTRSPIVGAEVRFSGATGALGTATTDAMGHASLSTTEAIASVEVRASEHVTEHWYGPGRAMTIPLQRRAALDTVEHTLTGTGAGSWTVLATAPARVLHASSLSTSAGVPCTVIDAGSCSFVLEAPVDATTSFFAFRTGASGPDELRVLGTLESADLAAAQRFGVTELDVSIPDPGEGSTAVVGVPGIAVSGRVAVLPWPMGEGSIRVPDTEDSLGSAWALFASTLADGSTSILLRRGVTEEAALDVWTGWLTAPTPVLDSGTLMIEPSPDAELVAVAFYAGDDLVAHALAAAAASVAVPPEATSAVVRAVDTAPLEAGTFVLDASERAASRIAERTITLGS